MPETLELKVGARLGGYARGTVNVREAIRHPCLRGLTLGESGDIEDLQAEGGRKSLTAPGDCLPHEDRALDAQQLLQPREPQQPVPFARLAPPALTFEGRTGQTESAVDIHGQHIKVRQNVPAGFCIHVDRHAEAGEGAFGELQPSDPALELGAVVARRGTDFGSSIAGRAPCGGGVRIFPVSRRCAVGPRR